MDKTAWRLKTDKNIPRLTKTDSKTDKLIFNFLSVHAVLCVRLTRLTKYYKWTT